MIPVSSHFPLPKIQNTVFILTFANPWQFKKYFFLLFPLNNNHNVTHKTFRHLQILATSSRILQNRTVSDSDCSALLIQQLNVTKHNETVTFNKSFQRKHVSYSLCLGCHFTMFSTKRQIKNHVITFPTLCSITRHST